MSDHTFSFAEKQDIPAILEFIRNHWSDTHVFLEWPELFEYCYAGNGEALTFAIVRDNGNGRLVGICGYIPSNHLPSPDIWVALWKVIPTGNPALGLELLEFVRGETGCRVFSCCGINTKVERIYSFLGFHTGTLRHYYRLADLPCYRIASVADKRILPAASASARLTPIQSPEELRARFHSGPGAGRRPYKDMPYLEKRYFQHPALYIPAVWD